MRNLRSAILLVALLGANAPGAGQETCRPVLSAKSSGHSDVLNFQRHWKGVFTVDASRCATTEGAFEIGSFGSRLRARTCLLREQFAWLNHDTEVNLDLTWDEFVNAYRISEIAPCPCRR